MVVIPGNEVPMVSGVQVNMVIGPVPVLCGKQSNRTDYEQTMIRHGNASGLSKMGSFLIMYSCIVTQLQR